MFSLQLKLPHIQWKKFLISGTPRSQLSIDAISELACNEAEIYARYNLVHLLNQFSQQLFISNPA